MKVYYRRINKKSEKIMAKLPFVVVGDGTTGGGKVIGGSPGSTIEGKPIARVGDMATCPIKGHGGASPIVTGDSTCLIDDRPAARHNDSLACGCKLLASQGNVTTGDAGGGGGGGKSKTAQSQKSQSASDSNESIASNSDMGEIVGNNAGTLVAGPAMSLFRKGDIVEWHITPEGNNKGNLFANAAKGFSDKFFTVGIHSRGTPEFKVQGDFVVFFDAKNNCLGYSLGRHDKEITRFKLLDGEDRFIPISVERELAKIKANLAGGKKFLPFDQPLPAGYAVLDMWQSSKNSSLWHVTRRHFAGGQTIIISKDGDAQSVQNFAAKEIMANRRLVTNTGGVFDGQPVYTMLIPMAAIGDWGRLSPIFIGSNP